jgi:hypothetical protein
VNKPLTFLLAVATLALAVCAQSPSSLGSKLSGTIDGRPIPDNVFQFNRYTAVSKFIATNHRLPNADEEKTIIAMGNSQRELCGNLRSYIGAEAHEAEILRLGIVPTKADIDAAASHTIGVSEAEVTAAYPKRHALSVALTDGFAAVLDNGQDPHVVYQQIIVPAGLPEITEDGWLGLLYTARTTIAGRKRLEHDSLLTLQGMIDQAKSQTAKSVAATSKPGGLTGAAAYEMVNRKVDQLIAAKDPTFATYLAEFPDPYHWSENGTHHHEYLDQKRNAYWRAITSKLNVRLSDPTLFDSCKLADVAVTVRE